MQAGFLQVPPQWRFLASDVADLVEVLREDDAGSSWSVLTSPDELYLDSSGRLLFDGHVYTVGAARQLCSRLSPGLFQVVQTLALPAGTGASARTDRAAEILNDFIRHRFVDALQGCKILRRRRERCVAGLTGARHQWLSNLRLYSLCVELLHEVGGGRIEFLLARLCGCGMMLRFFLASPLLQPEGDDPYCLGYHVSNHEAGLAGVYGAPLLVRRSRQTASRLEGGGFKLRHVGRRFETRLVGHLRRLFRTEVDVAAELNRLRGLRAISLGLGPGGRSRVRRKAQLTAALVRLGVARAWAARIVDQTMLRGAHETVGWDSELIIPEETAASRSGLDLYVAMGREAQFLSIAAQERLEREAGELSRRAAGLLDRDGDGGNTS